MITRFVIYPYKVSSESAHRLKDSLKEAGHKAIIVYPDRAYSWKENDLIIGWGMSKRPAWEIPANAPLLTTLYLNPHNLVELSIDKKKAFQRFAHSSVNIPEFTDQEQEAFSWLADGFTVIGRKQLRGMKGNGVCVFKKKSDFESCKFYTKFVPNTEEYRIYVFGDEVIDKIQKRRVSGTHDFGYCRSEENGWVFCRYGVHPHTEVLKQAIKATKALGLFFAGVDVLWSINEHKAYVLETNTCPDIFGTGLRIFRDAFINLAKEL